MKNHMKRLVAPSSWGIKRKAEKFVSRPKPGAHSFTFGTSMNILLRNILSYSKTTKETKAILNGQKVLVNGARRKDAKDNVGFMDIISFPDIEENYRLLLDKKGRLFASTIEDSQSKLGLVQIMSKTAVKGKFQINCSNGRNILVDKNDYKVGDSLLFDFDKKQVKAHFPFKEGATIYLMHGKRTGIMVKLIKVLDQGKISCEVDGEVFETIKDYAFVVGDDKPAFDIEIAGGNNTEK